MKSAVVVFPGSNCDRDVAVALHAAAGRAPAMVWHRDADIPSVDLIVLPGGFSYGDYLRCGAMAAHSPVMREVAARAKKGVAVLGICNGFQILTEAGLLPGALLPNSNLQFICREVCLRVEEAQRPFTSRYSEGNVIRMPIAHRDGNYFADAATLDTLEGEGRVALRYCAEDGAATDEANPNGSARNIAGIFNDRGNVMGLMPHPERAFDPVTGRTDGRPVFEALIEALN
ncbi:MAG TPA: phosphoribosylformylglycinamidine synthase subunit PurQ [Alphaproteobacteria bacterium]|nr:phosphoribosylformylglycinamidine synthase subunit PurQ [Alphaproteobacteria bacterium]